jgi:hypothetical protein
VELAIAAWLARRAHAAGATALRGRYVPSKKNGLARGFWTDAGFADEGDGAHALALDAGLPEAPAWINLLEGNEVAR